MCAYAHCNTHARLSFLLMHLGAAAAAAERRRPRVSTPESATDFRLAGDFFACAFALRLFALPFALPFALLFGMPFEFPNWRGAPFLDSGVLGTCCSDWTGRAEDFASFFGVCGQANMGVPGAARPGAGVPDAAFGVQGLGTFAGPSTKPFISCTAPAAVPAACAASAASWAARSEAWQANEYASCKVNPTDKPVRGVPGIVGTAVLGPPAAPGVPGAAPC